MRLLQHIVSNKSQDVVHMNWEGFVNRSRVTWGTREVRMCRYFSQYNTIPEYVPSTEYGVRRA